MALPQFYQKTYGEPTSYNQNQTGSFASVYNQALVPSEAQYNATLAAYQAREKGIDSKLDTIGANELAQADAYYMQQAEGVKQNATSRGLGNTTILNSLQQGVNAQRDAAMAQIHNNIANTRLGIGLQTSGDTLNYMGAYADRALQARLQAAQSAVQQGQYQTSLAEQGRMANVGAYLNQNQFRGQPTWIGPWPQGPHSSMTTQQAATVR